MTSPDESLTNKIGHLCRVVHADESLESSLRRVADTALNVINRCDAASVTLAEDGTISTWVSTDEAAEEIDEHQYRSDEGPCLDAIRTGEANFVDSLTSDQRWPSFRPRAVAEGMTAVYSLPLKVGGETVGALNLYSRSKSFAFPDLQAAEALAAQAAVTLANARAYQQAQERISDLENALEERDASGQEADPGSSGHSSRL